MEAFAAGVRRTFSDGDGEIMFGGDVRCRIRKTTVNLKMKSG